MRPNKIIQIITKLELGGAQEIALDLCRQLLRENYETILITNPEGVLVPEAKSIKGIKIYFVEELKREINPLADIKCLYKLKKIIREENPDIVHTHSSKSGILGRIAAKMNKVPVIVHTIHGFGFNDYQKSLLRNILIFLEKMAASYTDKLIAVSPAVMKKGIDNKIGCEEKYHVIYNGIDVDLYRNTKVDRIKKLSELGLKPDMPVIGMVACFKPQKAPLDFVKLANLICHKNPDVQFILAGDGVLRKEIENLVKKLALEKKFNLLGWRKDIHEILSVMDIFVLTSLWEGLPLTLLEAMAAGKPVIVNAIDGNIDVIRDEENGFLCEPGNIEEMADKIILLLGYPEKAREIGEKGNLFVRKFDRKRMLEENMELYKKIYGKKGK